MPTAPPRRPPARKPAPPTPPPQPRRTEDRPQRTVDRPARAPRERKDRCVTYRGPVNRKDQSTTVIVPHDNPRRDEHFPIDQPVETTQGTANRLAAMAGHTFHIEPARPEGDTHVRQ